MVLPLNVDRDVHLLPDLLRDGQNGSLRRCDRLLRAAAGDDVDGVVVAGPVHVDLRARLVLDPLDVRAALAQDARDGLGRDVELDGVVRLFLEFGGLRVDVERLESRIKSLVSLTSSSSLFAPATPFLPPLMSTSSDLSDSRVCVFPSPSPAASRGNVILTPYFSSSRMTYLPLCPIKEEWY